MENRNDGVGGRTVGKSVVQRVSPPPLLSPPPPPPPVLASSASASHYYHQQQHQQQFHQQQQNFTSIKIPLETQHQIEKLSEYVAKNGAEFEQLTRQKSLDMFWWLDDLNSNEYRMYKLLLESKMGTPSASVKVVQPPVTTTTTDKIQEQIEEAKLRAQKLMMAEKETKLEYVDDTTLFDNIVGNIPQNTRIANAGFQNGTYNAIDLLSAPKNVNEEMMQKKSKIVEKYFEKRMELFEYELDRATTNKYGDSDNSNNKFLYRNANENEEDIEELREIRRHRRRRGETHESAEEMEEKFNASRGSKRGLGMAEQEERNGDVEFLKYRNQLSRRYHGGN
jgi:hypothetical protein